MASQDCQSYLNEFNKELEDGMSEGEEFLNASLTGDLITIESKFLPQSPSSSSKAPQRPEVSSNENIVIGEIGTYFVDQDGNYFFQTTKNCIEQMIGEPPLGVTLNNIKVPPTPKVNEKSAAAQNNNNNNSNKKRTTRATSNKTEELATNENNCLEYVFMLKDDQVENPDVDGTDMITFNPESDDSDTENLTDGIETKHKVVRVRLSKTSASNLEANGIVYACNYCDYTTYKPHMLARHLQSHTDERPFKCSVCERGFKTKVALTNHVNVHLGNKPHGCKYCEKAFTTAGELVRHVRYKHTGEKPHKCTECEYASVEMSKLRRHMRCHTGERPYQCPHCTYASPDSFKLKRHLRIHTGEKPYKCDICHTCFAQSNSLKSHKQIHSVGDKPVFQCQFCPTTCGRKTDLRSHINHLHTSDKPIPCKRCDQQLPDRYSYKMHIKTHEGEKCFRCDVCSYASSSMRHLRAHILVHTDEKPYVCDHCGLAFRQPALLKRHENLYHTKDYVPPQPREKLHVCPHCDKRYTHNGNLIRHMEMHDPESNTLNVKDELKQGRQKRIKLESLTEQDEDSMNCENDVDNQLEEFVTDEDEEENDDDASTIERIESIEILKYLDDEKATTLSTDNTQVVLQQRQRNDKTTTTIVMPQKPRTKHIIKDEDKEFVAVDMGDDSEYMVFEVIKSPPYGDADDNDILIAPNETYDREIAIPNNNTKSDLANSFDFHDDIDPIYENDNEDNKDTIEFLNFIEDY